MTLEIVSDAPDAVIGSAERIHEHLADTVGPDAVLVTVETSGAVQTTIATGAGVDYPCEWDLDGPVNSDTTTDDS